MSPIKNKLFNSKPAPKKEAPRVVRPDIKARSQDPSWRLYRALPFKNRRMNFTDWIYKNKLGVTALVLAILVLFFSFSIVKFEISTIKQVEGFFVEVPPELLTPEQIEMEMEEQVDQEMFEDVQNIASNEDSELNESLKDDRGTAANELYAEAKELQERLNKVSREHSDGVREAEELNVNRDTKKDAEKDKNDENKRKDSKVSGNVTVSYSLDGRNASYLPAPAYKCENGGRVVVNIVVNNNGDVESASIDKTSSKEDNCLNEVAVNFAKQTRFETGSTWPQKHKGTITYLFLSQRK